VPGDDIKPQEKIFLYLSFLGNIAGMKGGSQLYKGSLTTIILKLLSEEGRMYGYEITKKVKELSAGEMKLTEGALYPALHKLEADGLVEVTVEQNGNRPRKYYRLTGNGKKEVQTRLEELREFIQHMNLLLDLNTNLIPKTK